MTGTIRKNFMDSDSPIDGEEVVEGGGRDINGKD